MTVRTHRRAIRAATHLIRIGLLAAFVLSAAGSAAASPSDDGAAVDSHGGIATPILFGAKLGTTGGGDGGW